ncbi:MAG: cohesin domain-containing protein [Candidatus Accumulibacter sp.]|uniref:cohesin domain-containing protein n=1 Tax=Accumulibacter sp. TaxID=2053492 RepID=UPI002879E5AE|nr:cohesin domain-containing protein [Accumulibacter sp.]MDS4016519.1 cohesin domain-containing protein [Accumulibacter sp.]
MPSILSDWSARAAAALLTLAWVAWAQAVPVSITLTPTPATAIASGDALTLAVRLNEAVSFNTLDATLAWDNRYLAPADQVAAEPFLALGSVFAGTGFAPAAYGSTPGASSISIALFSWTDPAERASGPGELFSLKFYVRAAGGLPASTVIQFGSLGAPGEALEGVGLALQEVFDASGNVLDPQPEPNTAAPPALAINLVPEPACGQLCLAGLLAAAVLSRRRRPA